jgi:hypothetical protein
MEDNKKLSFTHFGDIRIERANVRVIEIGAGSLKFALDERYPYYIKVYIGDSSDEGFEYIDDISGIDPKINDDEFMTIVLNYCVQHVEFITNKAMEERVQKYYKKLEKENQKVKQILSQYTDEQLLNEVNERGLLGGN